MSIVTNYPDFHDFNFSLLHVVIDIWNKPVYLLNSEVLVVHKLKRKEKTEVLHS